MSASPVYQLLAQSAPWRRCGDHTGPSGAVRRASTADERGELAAACVGEALNTVTFSSPEGHPTRVTVTSD